MNTCVQISWNFMKNGDTSHKEAIKCERLTVYLWKLARMRLDSKVKVSKDGIPACSEIKYIPQKKNMKDVRWKSSSNLRIFVKVYIRTRHKYNMYTVSNSCVYIKTHICLWLTAKCVYFTTKLKIVFYDESLISVWCTLEVPNFPSPPLTYLFIYLSIGGAI